MAGAFECRVAETGVCIVMLGQARVDGDSSVVEALFYVVA